MLATRLVKTCAILFLLGAGVLSSASSSAIAAPRRAEVVRRANAKFFVPARKKLLSRNLTCNFSRGRTALGYITTKSGKKTFRVLSSKELKAARKKKLHNICPSVCARQIRAIEIGAVENTPTRITPAMMLKIACNPRASLEIVGAPILGQAIATSSGIDYIPHLHVNGIERLRLRFKGVSTSASAAISISSIAGTEFVGRALEISPYRVALTPNEVDHLLQKVGADNDAQLRHIGITQGREALVEAILNYQSPNLTSVNSAANTLAEQYQYFDYFVFQRNYRHSPSLRAFWLAQMLEGNPLRERMMLFWHHHFAINLDALKFSNGAASNWWLQEHFEILRARSLGSFRSLLQAMRDDPAMSGWLNNSQNQYRLDVFQQNPAATTNDNFGRELMELFTIGRTDRFNQSIPYYNETDVKSAALAMTGQHLYAPSSGLIPGYGGWYNGNGVTQGWELNRSFRGRITMFSQSGVGVLDRSIVDRDTLMDHLLFNHPGTARNLAFKLISYFAFPQTQGDNVSAAEQAPTNTIAEILLANGYEVIPALRTILNSSLMFAPESRDTCIQSPTEQIVSAARRIGLPLQVLEIQSTPWQLESAFADSINGTGHAILDLPTVFAGQKQCGASLDSQRAHGEGWLEDQSIFNRLRAVGRILDFSMRGPSSNYWEHGAGVKLKDTLLNGLVNPSAEEVLTRIESRFGVSLNVAQHRRILDTLNPFSAPWSGATEQIKEQRLAQVTLALVAVFPQFIMR